MLGRLLTLAAAVAAAAVVTAPAGAYIPDPDAAAAHAAHPGMHAVPRSPLAPLVARARVATARYATDLDRALADGYRIITPMMPGMGFHFLNPDVQEFDPERPPILVYLRRGGAWQLGALEWVFPTKPARPPLPGARYGSFGAACHYEDGTFAFEETESDCAATSAETGSPFSFWHPRLVTLHVWAWYPNPRGVFNGTNPLVRPFDGAQLGG